MTINRTAQQAQVFGQTISPYGFGCAWLRDGASRAQSHQLLRAALDAGITYFDTARLYGEGEAESVLGSFLGDARKRVILATKAGILPAHATLLQKIHGKAHRILRETFPPAAKLAPAPKPVEPRFNVFDPSEISRSLETSLRNLRTDYVDIFLLHEPSFDVARDPRIIDLLIRFKKEGKIRHFGVAPSVADAPLFTGAEPSLEVLQFNDSVWTPNERLLDAATGQLKVTHSCLGPALAEAFSRLKDRADFWSDAGLPPGDAGALARHLLAHAAFRNAGGVVLFSSQKPENIRSNVAAGDISQEAALRVAEALKAKL